MGLYLYCIAPRGHVPAAGLTGIDDAPVRPSAAGPFTLWVSELDAAPAPNLARIRRHSLVVESASTTEVTPVPLRFGQWLDSPVELERRVLARTDDHQRALRTLAGADEFGVTLFDPALARPGRRSPAPGTSSGREYLAALARREANDKQVRLAGRAAADALRSMVAGLVRAERIDDRPSPRGFVQVAHLVARHDFSAYRKAIEAFRGRNLHLRVLVSGPWPPYSFVS